MHDDIDGLVQERRDSSALAMEIRLSCINRSMSSHAMLHIKQAGYVCK